MKNKFASSWGNFTLSALLFSSAPLLALEFGNIEITQLNNTNNGMNSDSPAVDFQILPGSTEGFEVVGTNRGDTDFQFGPVREDDVSDGLLFTSPSNNARNNFAGGDTVNGLNFATTSVAIGGTGYYFVPTHNMGGSAQNNNGRAEYNIDFSIGYFPYDVYLATHAGQTSNGGATSELIGNKDIILGTHFIDESEAGVFTVDLTELDTPGPYPVKATAENGILLALHGKNEGNFAMAQDNPDGSFTLSVMDNGQFGGGVNYEQDSSAFVYLPTNVVGPDFINALGRIQSDGSAEVSGGNFTVTPRRSMDSLGDVYFSGSFESPLTDDEATFTTALEDMAGETYLLEILSGPDVGTLHEITDRTDTVLTIASSLTAAAEDYPIEFRVGPAGHEYLLEVDGMTNETGTLLVAPAGGYTGVTENDIVTGTFESSQLIEEENSVTTILTDTEGTFSTTLPYPERTAYFLEITTGPDAGYEVELIPSDITEGTISVPAKLSAQPSEYPVEFRVFTKIFPNNTDNFVTNEWSEADQGWVVQSRDVPEGYLTEKGATDDEDIFNFVFLTSDPSNAQPAVTITSPVADEQFVVGSTITLEAEAIDEDGGVAQVDFLQDGIIIGTDTTAPYSFTIPSPFNSLGSYDFNAVVTDTSGGRTFGLANTVHIVPPSGSGGMYFNGVNQYVTFGNAESLGLSTFTLETWFKPEGTFGQAAGTGSGGVTAYPLVTKGRGEDDQSNLDMNYFLGIHAEDKVLVADFEGSDRGENVPVEGFTKLEAGQWYHAAVTFDGTEWRLYLNGNLEATRDAEGLMPRADSIQHAALASALNSNGVPGGYFQGSLDEVRIWAGARTQSELREFCNSEIPTATNLIARWGFTEAGGESLTSSASGAVSGTILGNPVWAAGQTFTDNAKPDVTITNPVDGLNINLGDTVNIEASATDSDGSIAKVGFYNEGVLISEDTSAPYEAQITVEAARPLLLTAVATDNAGQTSRSDFVGVTVEFPTPTIPGYTVGVVDGGDLDRDKASPANPANWVVESTTASPALGSDGTNTGDFNPTINGERVDNFSGLFLGSNYPTLDNLAALDNVIGPDNAGNDQYYISMMDIEGPGADDPTAGEESSRMSLGFFPWADGWFGGKVAADGTVDSDRTHLPEGVTLTVTKTGSGQYRLEGLPITGNLIAMAYDNGSSHVVAVAQEENHWLVTTRDRSQSLADRIFGFLYVPATSRQVYSGLVQNDGTLVPLNDELRLSGGSAEPQSNRYQVRIGDGTVINPSNSVMFLTADFRNGNGGDNVYSYFDSTDAFTVFSQDLPRIQGDPQDGGFRFLIVPLENTGLNGDEVHVAATANATEGEQNGLFTFTREGDLSTALTVPFTVGGTATSGTDYTALPGSVTFTEGSNTATLTVEAATDGFLELPETVVVTLTPGAGYSIGTYGTAQVIITNVNPTVATTTVTFQEGVDGYTGQFGMRLIETGTTQLGSAVEEYYLDGHPDNDSSNDTNGIVRFDNIFGDGPGQIPPGAGIQDAQLIMSTSTAGDAQSGGPYIIDILTVPVDENTKYADLQLGEKGDDFEGVRGSVTGIPVAGFGAIQNGQVVSANVTYLVQLWSDYQIGDSFGIENYGFAIYTGGTSDGWSYNTVGNVNPELRPKLVVTYSTNNTLKEYYYEADMSSVVNNRTTAEGANQPSLDGSTVEKQFMDLNDGTSGTTETLFRFPVTFGEEGNLQSIPDGETVVKAELLLFTPTSGSDQSSGPYALHPVLEEWDTTTTFGVNGPTISQHIDPALTQIVGMGQKSVTFGDVTPAVQDWRAGRPNYGLNVKPETTDGWAIYMPGVSENPGLATAAPLLRVTTAIIEETSYDQYMAANGATGANFLDDRDNDGVVGLLEYALGLDPTAFNVLPGLQANGSNYLLSYAKGSEAATDPRLEYIIETSTDLEEWTKVTPATNDSSEISAVIPGPLPPAQTKVFARIRVEYNN
ncbi:Ig-like domain-containing protein [Roseibacillus ishigakijimensis]|uniref:DNRLRE domain-containing protein n=1 Tax=Roseibacillus ishigakijimensis TaxID=454146 RepID=A0A934VM29_9BACT|nr:Ig-like domain-containing protein [Roseibacillus ishigakijimensis]MBK1835309.1 DNRLRE domain-containing protein [Roseibacillus ishigakijimensis]